MSQTLTETQQQAAEKYFEQDHTRPRKRMGQADLSGPTRNLTRLSPSGQDHFGFGNCIGLAPALSAGNRQTSSPFCHCPTAQGFVLR